MGSVKAPAKSVGSSRGTSSKRGGASSAEGVGGKLSSDTTQDINLGPHKSEPIENRAAYRKNAGISNSEYGVSDPKFTGANKPQTGTPRQEAAYVNRDRQGSGLETQPAHQRKLPSYPGGKKAKGAKEEKKFEY